MIDDPAMLGQYNYQRNERDWYPTPPDVTNAIVDFMKNEMSLHSTKSLKTIWEPACGDGAMANVLAQHWNVICSDIHPLKEGAVKASFYDWEPEEPYEAIITNPPFGKEIDKFIERAMVFAEKKKWVLFVGRHELDCAKGRARWFADNPHFYGKITLLWRPKWIADSDGSPRHNYAVYIWSPFVTSTARLFYADKT